MVRYMHRQTSYRAMLLILPIAAVVGSSVYFASSQGKPPPLFIPVIAIAIVVIAAAIFSTLIIEVTDDAIAVGFLFGAMRRRVARGEIMRAERCSIPWWYGTGVKYGLKATSYLAWPGPAVELTLKSGRALRIGTDDPDGLLVALKG